MQIAVLHLLSLAAHGRVLLRGRQLAALPAEVDMPPHVESMAFDHLFDDHGAIGRDTVARGAADWLRLLQRTGHTSLAAYCVPRAPASTGMPPVDSRANGPAPAHPPPADWQTAGFANGGCRWLIGASSPAGADYWESHWQLLAGPEVSEASEAPDATDAPQVQTGATWALQFSRVIRADARPPPVVLSLPMARQALLQALVAARGFATAQALPGFAEVFGQAHGLLLGHGEPPADTLCGAPLPSDARRLAAAAQAAWVFGGMGSWNDQGFEGAAQASFEQVSAELYGCLCQALAAAANAAAAPAWWRRWLG